MTALYHLGYGKAMLAIFVVGILPSIFATFEKNWKYLPGLDSWERPRFFLGIWGFFAFAGFRADKTFSNWFHIFITAFTISTTIYYIRKILKNENTDA